VTEIDFAEDVDNPGAATPHSTRGTIDDTHNHKTILSSQNVKELEKNEVVCRARIKTANVVETEDTVLLRLREPESLWMRVDTANTTHPTIGPTNKPVSKIFIGGLRPPGNITGRVNPKMREAPATAVSAIIVAFRALGITTLRSSSAGSDPRERREL